MEENKYLLGESTKREIFPGIGREWAHFWLVLDSSLFSVPVGKTLQFAPNLDQNQKTLHILILYKNS